MVLVLSRMRHDDEGAVAVLVSVLALLLFSIAAFVVDLGMARDNRRQAQNTADAAALAAANALYSTTAANLNAPGNFPAAVRAAKEFAAANYGVTEADWAGCSIPASEALPVVWPQGGTNCISFDKSPYPTNVLVRVPLRKMPTLFGAVMGYQGLSISAIAQARIAPGGRPLCTFCVLSDEESHLQNGSLDVVGGNMWFNGDVRLGATGNAGSEAGSVLGEDGEYYTDGGNVYVAGDVIGWASNLQGGTAQSKQPKVVDPLAASTLPFPTQATLAEQSDPCTDGPGIYGEYRLTGGTCSLDPGLYVFTGDLELAGNATTSFEADGVTMYFTCGTADSPQPCSSGQQGGGLKITGNGSYTVTAPTLATHPSVPAELYGWGIVYDRYNTNDLFLAGNGTQSLTGTIYAVSATMDNRGNGCTTVSTSYVIVGQVEFSGTNSCFTTVFDSTKNVKPSDGGRGLVR